MATLVLLRHGESEWNQTNLFTGWVDVDLTEKGEEEARRGGELLREAGLLPTVVHTSRADPGDPHRQPGAGRAATGRGSRCTGTGGSTSGTTARCRARTRSRRCEEYGEEQFMLWRRSYDMPPPPIEPGAEWDVSRRPALRAAGPGPRAAHRVPRRRRRPAAAVLVRRDRAGPAGRADRAGRRARQLAARAGEAPRRARRAGGRRRSTSRPGSRCATTSTTSCGRRCPAGSTSTRRPPRRRPPRWPRRGAEAGRQATGTGRCPVTR